jgi:O-antigen ligase
MGATRRAFSALLVAMGLLVGAIGLGRLRVAEEPWRPEVETAVRHWVEPGLGVNVDFLSMSPEQVEEAAAWAQTSGLRWVRQLFSWALLEPQPGGFSWAAADAAVDACRRHDLELIAVLGQTPSWARPRGQEHAEWSPPEDYSAFGAFAQAFARRYGSQIRYYQIWDQPNIYPFWGDQWVDPTAYGRLLREAALAIKAADPDGQAFVLSAALAPNLEPGPLNLNELEFLRALCHSGACGLVDIVGAKAYGFDQGVHLGGPGLHFGRLAELHRVAEECGLRDRQIWAVEFGWNSLPPDWAGPPAPWGSASPAVQGERVLQAITLARSYWPWLGPLLWARLYPPPDPTDPAAGFALRLPSGPLTSLGEAVMDSFRRAPSMGVGFHRPNAAGATYKGRWRVNSWGADPSAAGDRLEVRFWGTGLDLLLRPGPYWAVWFIRVDGVASPSLPCEDGRSYLVLYDPLGRERSVTVAADLPLGIHVVEVEVDGGWGQWPLVGWVVHGVRPAGVISRLGLTLLAVALAFAGLAIAIVPLVGRLRPKASAILREASSLPPWAGLLAVAATGAAFWLLSGAPESVAASVLLATGCVLWPEAGVAFALASLPFFLVPKPFLGVRLMMPEVMAWVVLGAILVRRLILGLALARVPSGASRFDMALAAFAGLSYLAVLLAPEFGVAADAYRRVILSATVLYADARLLGPRKSIPLACVGLVAGAIAISVVAIWQYASGNDLIQAAEVGRVRGLYGSPNNLALYLERVVFVALSFALWAKSKLGRSLSGVAAAIILCAAVLTRSRGMLLLGLPVGAAALAWWLVPARRRLLAAAAVLLLALALGVAVGWKRFASLARGLDMAAAMRLRLWQSSFNMIADRPIFGFGPDNFLYAYRTRYILPAAWQEPELSHPHNILLDFWISTGLGGVLSFGWLLALAWRRGRALAHSSGAVSSSVVVAQRGAFASLLAMFAHGLVDNSFFLVDLSHACLWCLAIMATEPAHPLPGCIPALSKGGKEHENTRNRGSWVHRVTPMRIPLGPRARGDRDG